MVAVNFRPVKEKKNRRKTRDLRLWIAWYEEIDRLQEKDKLCSFRQEWTRLPICVRERGMVILDHSTIRADLI